MIKASDVAKLSEEAIALLQELIRVPSFSKDEAGTADVIQRAMAAHGVETARVGNNVWARNKVFDSTRPTLLLNSHHDTVKPNKLYTLDPFLPTTADGKLFGLGSNDAGGPLVSLLASF